MAHGPQEAQQPRFVRVMGAVHPDGDRRAQRQTGGPGAYPEPGVPKLRTALLARGMPMWACFVKDGLSQGFLAGLGTCEAPRAIPVVPCPMPPEVLPRWSLLCCGAAPQAAPWTVAFPVTRPVRRAWMQHRRWMQRRAWTRPSPQMRQTRPVQRMRPFLRMRRKAWMRHRWLTLQQARTRPSRPLKPVAPPPAAPTMLPWPNAWPFQRPTARAPRPSNRVSVWTPRGAVGRT